jgi:hypothetical protein
MASFLNAYFIGREGAYRASKEITMMQAIKNPVNGLSELLGAARRSHIGDGKIFASKVDEAIRFAMTSEAPRHSRRRLAQISTGQTRKPWRFKEVLRTPYFLHGILMQEVEYSR